MIILCNPASAKAPRKREGPRSADTLQRGFTVEPTQSYERVYKNASLTLCAVRPFALCDVFDSVGALPARGCGYLLEARSTTNTKSHKDRGKRGLP